MAVEALPSLPPLDGSLTIPETLDFHLQHNADRPVYVFSQENTPNDITAVTYREFARACHRVAHAVRPGREGEDGRVVAIIALVDTIVYQAMTVGLMKASLVPFPISSRNSPAAVVKLLRQSSCHTILATKETLGSLFEGVKAEMFKTDPNFELDILEVPSLHYIYPKLGFETESDPFQLYPGTQSRVSLDAWALYLHSSGSTGLPNCIPQTHRMMVEWASFRMYVFAARNIRYCIGTMALPSFHTLGIYSQLIQPLYGSLCIAVYPPVVTSPTSQPFIPTSDNIIDHLRRTKSNGLVIVPAILHLWAQSPEAINLLKELSFVSFSGGPLTKKVGDMLTSAGINVKAAYGGTEFGATSLPQLERGHESEWEWIQFSNRTNINWVDQGDGTYECQYLTSDTHHPAVENMENPRGYATSDLFAKHPTIPDHWKIVGRIDDVIMHSSGEKTVPAPIEEVIMSSPLVKGVILFGRNHDQPGALVEPAGNYTIDVDDPKELATFRNQLWPVIEDANKRSPAFSRIYKEMVLVTQSDKPLPRSPKGTIMRKAALQDYVDEIENLYKIVETNAGGDDVVPPAKWDLATVRSWLSDQTKEIMSGKEVSPSKDLFEQGLDSLSATILRLRVIGALKSQKDQPTAAHKVAQNAIYTYPRIDDLTKFIVDIMENPEASVHQTSGTLAIEKMIEKYSEGLALPIAPTEMNLPDGATVLITGSTGHLGSQILSTLLQDKGVKRIYALNRPSGSVTIIDRHKQKFEDKGLDINLLSSDKLRFIEGEAGENKLGLGSSIYDELQKSVTLIIHVAWKLDFNLTLSSFEGNIRGTRNLIDLGRSSRHASSLRFLFTSSISAAQSWDQTKGPYPEEVVENPVYAVGGGYGAGKYVAERILARSGLKASSLRVGQVSGGLPNGAWATSDWVPILVKSSLAIGALPTAEGVISWIPMDGVSDIILDVAFSSEAPPVAMNVVHPRPELWKTIMSSLSESLQNVLNSERLPLIPYQEWVERVEKVAENAKETEFKAVPAIKLLEFFRRMARANALVTGGMSKFETIKAEAISTTMRDLPSVGRADANRWVGYWHNQGYL